MNPLGWKREHQIALVLGGSLGAMVGAIYGAIHRVEDHLLRSFYSDAAWQMHMVMWAAVGCLLGATLVYVQRLLRS